MSIMCELCHPSVVNLLGYSCREGGGDWLIMLELCKVDLFSYLNDPYLVGKYVGMVRQVVGFVEIERISSRSLTRRMLETFEKKFPSLARTPFVRSIINCSEEPSSIISMGEFEERIVREACEKLRTILKQQEKGGERKLGEKEIDQIEQTALRKLDSATREAHEDFEEALEHCRSRDIRERKSLPDHLRLQWSFEIAEGMRYLHHFVPSILHGDLKSPNVLLTFGRSAKIADFGLSGRAEKGQGMVGNLGGGEGGDGGRDGGEVKCNPMWGAPEVLRGEVFVSGSDVYSFGVVMWELWERKTPFFDLEYNHFMGMERIKMDVLSGVRPSFSREVGKKGGEGDLFVKLMKRCWAQESRDRPSFEEVVSELRQLCDMVDNKTIQPNKSDTSSSPVFPLRTLSTFPPSSPASAPSLISSHPPPSLSKRSPRQPSPTSPPSTSSASPPSSSSALLKKTLQNSPCYPLLQASKKRLDEECMAISNLRGEMTGYVVRPDSHSPATQKDGNEGFLLLLMLLYYCYSFFMILNFLTLSSTYRKNLNFSYWSCRKKSYFNWSIPQKEKRLWFPNLFRRFWNKRLGTTLCSPLFFFIIFFLLLFPYPGSLLFSFSPLHLRSRWSAVVGGGWEEKGRRGERRREGRDVRRVFGVSERIGGRGEVGVWGRRGEDVVWGREREGSGVFRRKEKVGEWGGHDGRRRIRRRRRGERKGEEREGEGEGRVGIGGVDV